MLDAADGARERSARGKRIAIVQSSYVPWKGYFDLMRRVDELVLLDDAQFTRRDWRNRNRIKTPQGPRWLTIPVEAKGKSRLAIREIRASDPSWPQRHWETVRHAYTRAPCFESFGPRIHELYRSVPSEMLSEINHHFLAALRDMLRIDARLTWSADYASSGRKSERLVSICTKAGATEYLSGPSARAYLDEDLFGAEGIDVIWMDYREYPEYEQLHPPFDHHVSVLDLLLHTGDRAVDYMLPDRGR